MSSRPPYCVAVRHPPRFALRRRPTCGLMRTSTGARICASFAATALCVLAPYAHADAFPDDYVSRGLAAASKGVTVDVAQLSEGAMLSVQYVGRPVYVYRRTPSDVAWLQRKANSELQDPRNRGFRESVRREFGSTSSTVWARLLLAAESTAAYTPLRSRDKVFLVIAGWGPSSGCALALVPPADRAGTGVVFRDPCTGATFDAAGRVFSRTPSTDASLSPPILNIAVPPYQLDGHHVVLGPATGQALPALTFSMAELCGRGSPTQSLICAARYNDIESVREALRAGADVNYFRPGEGSPIDAAIIGSSIEVINLLLEHGATPTPNSEGAAHFVQRDDVLTLLRGRKS